jgi:hypothetical protein
LYRPIVTLEGRDVTDRQSRPAAPAVSPAWLAQFSEAVAVAVFSSLPCLTWEIVTVSVAEQVVVSPTCNVVVGQATGLRPASGSFTASWVKVVFPLLVTENR